jgi:D-alanyl-D-alanine carboxypeptidase (penicillin-binding protein 5/6)
VKIFFLKLVILVFLFSTISNASEKGCSKSYSYLVLEEKTGEILLAKRPDQILYPASLVKLMTLYLTFEAIENGNLNADKILITSARGEEVSKVNKNNTLHLKEGDHITVRESIHGVIVKSFNEAAVTLAEAVAGNEWNFVRQMNLKAKQLGMINSSFSNASGLHSEGQYTTTYDLARLTKAMKNNFPQYYHLFALKKFSFEGVNYETHNHVLVKYKGAEGMKTGFTNAAGFNLISSAKKGDKRVISILLGCATFQSRDQLTENLLDKAFKKLRQDNDKSQFEVRLDKGFKYEEQGEEDESYESEMRFGMVQLSN